MGENVPGLFSSNDGDFFGGILSDLAALGYVVGWCCYGAVDVGALHRRDRVFIVGYSEHKEFNRCGRTWNGRPESSNPSQGIWDAGYWSTEPNVGRVANGVPHRVDRLKALGNAVVPAQIYPVYKAIVDIEGGLEAQKQMDIVGHGSSMAHTLDTLHGTMLVSQIGKRL